MCAAFHDYDSSIGGYRYFVLASDGDKVESCHGGPDEEGASHRSEAWILDGDRVVYRSCDWGRDCDGAYRRDFEAWCPVGDLAAGQACEDGDPLPFGVPVWRQGKASQRDYAAEAAGY